MYAFLLLWDASYGVHREIGITDDGWFGIDIVGVMLTTLPF